MAFPGVWAEPQILKYGTIEPPTSFYMVNIIKPFFDRVEKDAGGTIKIQMYSAGSLGRNPTKYLKHVKDGIMDMGWIINTYQPGRFPDDKFIDIPFIANDALESSLAVNHMVEKGLLRGYEGVEFLGIICLEQYTIHYTFPAKLPGDLRGEKMRVGGTLRMKIFEAMGVANVGITAPKFAESVSRGIISGVFVNWAGAKMFKLLDVTNHHTVLPLGTSILSVVMNKKVYQRLPAKARAAFEKHRGLAFARSFGEENNQAEKDTLEEMQNDPKHNVYIPIGEELKKWKAVISPVVEKWKEENPKMKVLVDAYRTEIERIRSK